MLDNIGSFEEHEDMQACLTVARRLVSKQPLAKAGRFEAIRQGKRTLEQELRYGIGHLRKARRHQG